MPSNASNERRRLLIANYEKIEYLYEQALRDGVDCPVVFLFDIRDKAGRAMAEIIAGASVVAGKEKYAADHHVDFSLLYALSRQDATRVVSTWPSRGKAILEEFLPSGVFPVVVIGGGGISWATHSMP